MTYRLSEGFLNRVMNGEQVEVQLIFQILVVKRVNIFKFSEDTDRYRLQISDGQSYNSLIMLAAPLNHLVYSNILTENSIVQINKYAISRIKINGEEKSVMVILNMEVIVPGHQIGKTLGNIDISFIEEKLQLIHIADSSL